MTGVGEALFTFELFCTPTPPLLEGCFSVLLSQSYYSVYVDLGLIRINRISLVARACARIAHVENEVIKPEVMAR